MIVENRADELETFKTRINLAEYAEACGFVLDKKESSRNCRVMRLGGEKIVITRAEDGHDVYFSVSDERDSGSIIDFVQRRFGFNLGQVRKELRPWVGLSAKPTERSKARKPEAERITRPEPIERDKAALLAAYHSLQPYDGDYLERERKLSPGTIKAFAPIIRKDAKGNVCFLHVDAAGDVVGWELKNRGFTGYAAGGRKALSMHMPKGNQVRRVVVTESMIDAMSYFQRHGREGDLYVSLAGTMSEAQKQQLRDLLSKAPAVAIAVDNDEQGHKYAAMLQQWRPGAEREVPSNGKDWNDELRHHQRGISMSM